MLLSFLLPSGHSLAQFDLQITEIFSGQAGDDLTADWFEIKNEGTTAWVADTDPGLYYDDESADPAVADTIVGISDIQPGEYAIILITDNPADIAVFTTIWGAVANLNGIKIGYTDGAGLGGGGDAVNIWIGDPNASSPVDTESYPDTGANDGQSYDIEIGAFSVVDNASGAVQTTALGGNNGDVPNIASPGNQGPVIIDPLAPVIFADSINAAPFLQIPVTGAAFIGADLNDVTDPALTSSIPFVIGDADTPVEDLVLTASSDNQSVISDANLVFDGLNNFRNLSISASGVGYASISIVITDTDGKTNEYTLNLAVSDATIDTNTTRFHNGSSDGSTAIAIDEDYMWVADDENQTIRLFDRNSSGSAIYSKNFNNDLGSDVEIDIEGSFRNGNTLFWMGSHTTQERSVIFSTTETGSGASATLEFSGIYSDLREDLIAWDDNDGHGKGSGFYGFTNGFEIEGLSADPNNPNGAYLGFRAPLVDGKALIVPVTNFQTIVSPNPTPNSSTFGAPIELDLEGHSIRSIECNSNGCLIVAGPSGTVTDFRLFTWTGNDADAPELRAVDLAAQASVSSIEGIVELPNGDFLGSNGDAKEVQLIVDTGTFDYYGDGSEAKDLPNSEWKKFRSERTILDSVQIPPIANPGDIVITEIMQNPDAVLDADGEWFELYNNTSGSIDINGWILQDNGSDEHVINNGSPLVIASGGYLILGNNGDVAMNGGVNVDYTYSSINLANSDDELVLITPDSIEIDRVEWDGGPNFPDPTGASMALQSINFDNNDGANWCEATTAYGDGDLGSPGLENDCPPPPAANLQITEIWAGQDGTDLTADWFEITNFGTEPWISVFDEPLYYDDESQDPNDADLINGITDIQPGESVIVVIDVAAAVTTFINVWSPDYDLTGVKVGWADGAGLGQGGDAVTLFLGTPSVANIADYESYPAPPSGISYDLVLGAFSQQGVGMVQTGTNIAIATTATAGSSGMEPAIGSPGNKGPLNAPTFDLNITEIFSGQVGTDLTADWFEIRNDGDAPWVAGLSPDLYYDDESADPNEAVLIQGIEEIVPGASAVVLITGNAADTTVFIDVWSPVIDLTGVGIGITDGAGLGGGGDVVTLWAGDPATTMPIDTASYPSTTNFDGQSYDVELQAFSVVGNANGAVQTLAVAGSTMDVPNIGSPGNGLATPPNIGLEITEIFPGQAGTDLTADWFEITNNGNEAWVAGVDDPLFYDDESADPIAADTIFGIESIAPGASVVVLVTDNPLDTTVFIDIWSPVIDLTGVQIGYTDGAGLGGGGDAVTLWLGDPNTTSPIDTASYPDTAPFDGQSFDSDLGEFSVVGNANGAVQTIDFGGSNMDVPNIGSPGNGLAIPPSTGLVITEIFSGQQGDDLTEDWFEIVNTGNQAWVSGVDPALFYDDESMNPVDADIIQGLNSIQPGATAIVLIGNSADITAFIDVWSPVIDLTGVEIGWADGAGLGGGGDVVTLWLGDPNMNLPIDTASYPSTTAFDGQSYDVDLGEFSVVGNANGAVQTLAVGGTTMDVPNIGSPGNGLAVPPNIGLEITEIFPGQEGDDLTADWFEITNTGNQAWISGMNADLFYDDESADPVDADLIQGISQILPGASAIVVLTDDPLLDTTAFINVWSPVIDLTGVEIGFTDGAGLGGGGDMVTLWLGDPFTNIPVSTAGYPETDLFDGQSYDSDLDAFSIVGNANGAVATIALGGDAMDVPNIGSPGNGLAIPQFSGLEISEIFSGQAGDDLTADWIEIRNNGPEAWIAGVNDTLYYDDESADPADAAIIQGITDIQPGELIIVLITDNAEDTTTFINVWSPVIDLTGIEIGFADGAGLGGGGDAVTLWIGEPANFLPIASASYPDTAPFDGQSYDSDLGEFSVVGNANGAVTTLALGGDAMDVPNIGSPGNGLAIPQFSGLEITEIFAGQNGADLTADWIEIRNNGAEPWVAGVDPDLYFDNENANPTEAVLIQGIEDILPGEIAIVVLSAATDTTTFVDVWSPVVNLSGIEIGFAEGAADLETDGDAVTLWLGEPSDFLPLLTAAYPGVAPVDGQSYDNDLGEYSVVDNANGAVQTIALGGDNADTPNIGSPGNQGPIDAIRELIPASALAVFPNPTAGKVTIQSTDQQGIETLSLVDMKGIQVYFEKVGAVHQVQLNIETLPAGVYYLQVQRVDGVAVKRIIKQ